MRVKKNLIPTRIIKYKCELEECPKCKAPIALCNYRSGIKIVQTMKETERISYIPGECVNRECESKKWQSWEWQQKAPLNGTYGYDVIAQIGWQRQIGHQTYPIIHQSLTSNILISESQVKYLYNQHYLPLMACHERNHMDQLKMLSESSGLYLGLDGLAPEGGEAQLWVIREMQSGLTIRSGWMSQQSQEAFEIFISPIVDAGLNVSAVMSDKQRGLYPAIQSLFPEAKHALCQAHYLKNMADPVATADQSMKVELRKAIRKGYGEEIRNEAVEGSGVLIVTGLLPTPQEDLPVIEPPSTELLDIMDIESISEQQKADYHKAILDERNAIIDDFKRQIRYLLTLKGRPPFRLAGLEMRDRLTEIADCLDQLLAHASDPCLDQLRLTLRQALAFVQDHFLVIQQAFDWLNQIAQLLDDDLHSQRSSIVVHNQLFDLIASFRSQLDLFASKPSILDEFLAHFEKVSLSYSPHIFHTYDDPTIPRTNNDRESDFRLLRHRLLSTSGQAGSVRRTLQRTGAWELIPTPSSLDDTIAALASVSHDDYLAERQRLRTHLHRFRAHHRSHRISQKQLQSLLHRWQRLPSEHPQPPPA